MSNSSTAPRARQSAQSFHTNDTVGTSDFLQDHRYTFQPGRSMLEYGHYVNPHGTLIVLYNSGSCLVQGADPQPGIDLLNMLVVAEEQRRGWL